MGRQRITHMPWGKFKGEPIEDLPTDYINWVLQQDWLRADLAEELENQLQLRDGKGVER